jgi:hypothetical protein
VQVSLRELIDHGLAALAACSTFACRSAQTAASCSTL